MLHEGALRLSRQGRGWAVGRGGTSQRLRDACCTLGRTGYGGGRTGRSLVQTGHRGRQFLELVVGDLQENGLYPGGGRDAPLGGSRQRRVGTRCCHGGGCFLVLAVEGELDATLAGPHFARGAGNNGGFLLVFGARGRVWVKVQSGNDVASGSADRRRSSYGLIRHFRKNLGSRWAAVSMILLFQLLLRAFHHWRCLIPDPDFELETGFLGLGGHFLRSRVVPPGVGVGQRHGGRYGVHGGVGRDGGLH